MSLICARCYKIIVLSSSPDHYGVCSSCGVEGMTEQEKALVDRSRLFVLGVPKKKFYRQVFEVEVLSESEPLNNVSLQDIAYEITVVGQFEIENT